ncbi:hypothetical protein HWV62_33559 [Athelia sp. TMB]|nr:hypothetical protein HWV62_33559 [Athelia sp. TMB]
MPQSCICGIAVSLEKDLNGFPSYQWALALHPTSYLAPDVRTFQILKDPRTALWRAHNARGPLGRMGTSAVFHLARIRCPLNTVRFLIEGLCPQQKGWDTHKRIWSCATWVLRAIEVMIAARLIREPTCPLVDVYDRVILCAARMEGEEGMRVVYHWLLPKEAKKQIDSPESSCLGHGHPLATPSERMLPSTVLLITQFKADLFAKQPCLADSYYGFFNGQSVFGLDSACFDNVWDDSGSNFADLAYGSIVSSERLNPAHQLVWLQEEAVDQRLWDAVNSTAASALDELLERLAPSRPGATSGQQILHYQPAEHDAYELLYRTRAPSAALVTLSPFAALTIDTLLPPFFKAAPLPATPIPFVPVPTPAVDRVKALLKTFRFDPLAASVVNSISLPWMRNDIRWLTGEDATSHIVSRHSFAEGSRVAAAWLKERFEDQGAACELRPFRTGFAPNVICRFTSTVKTNATVLLSAHYDSRGSFGATRAPGGDDDGSGVMALLGIARAIYRRRITFRSNVEFVAFAGEEQGLLGSKAYARQLREQGADITLMIQADMLAYRAPGEPMQLGLPEIIGTPEVAQLVWNASTIYSPELTVGWTAACCSDHQSFHMEGFPAAQVFERAGPIVDPMYHNSGDVSDRANYDFEQVRSIAKVEFAVLLHAAGWDLPESE